MGPSALTKRFFHGKRSGEKKFSDLGSLLPDEKASGMIFTCCVVATRILHSQCLSADVQTRNTHTQEESKTKEMILPFSALSTHSAARIAPQCFTV